MREKIISDYSIFMPDSSRRILLDYPELAKNKSFKRLSPEDVMFVWYFACEASPFFDIKSDRKKVQHAIDNAYSRKGGGYLIPKNSVEDYLSGKFPEKIKNAIFEMTKFRVGPRVRALQVLEKGFAKLESILDVDPDSDKGFEGKDGTIDFAKKKAYVDTFKTAMEAMPKIIEQMEQRYSVVEIKEGQSFDDEGSGFIDDLIDTEG